MEDGADADVVRIHVPAIYARGLAVDLPLRRCDAEDADHRLQPPLHVIEEGVVADDGDLLEESACPQNAGANGVNPKDLNGQRVSWLDASNRDGAGRGIRLALNALAAIRFRISSGECVPRLHDNGFPQMDLIRGRLVGAQVVDVVISR